MGAGEWVVGSSNMEFGLMHSQNKRRTEACVRPMNHEMVGIVRNPLANPAARDALGASEVDIPLDILAG
jgi:hypothetical protein